MKTVVVICAIAASAFIGPPVWAALSPILDQYNGCPGSEAAPNYLDGVGSSTKMAQTFTAGVSGTLAYIQIGNTTDVTPWGTMSPPVVQIRDTVVGTQGVQPGSTILGSVPLSYPVPYYVEQVGWITPDMSGSPGPVGWTPLIPFNISVTENQMYSIVLWAAGQTGAVSAGATKYDSYDDGALWKSGDGGWLLQSGLRDIPVYDMQFRTYVVPVPLPAGVWLGIFAVSIAGWHLKRQRA